MSIDDTKRQLRDQVKARRDRLSKTERVDAAAGLRDNVLCSLRDFSIMPPAIAAGYCPFQGEIDPLPAMKTMAMRGFGLSLPAIDEEDAPLAFQSWNAGDALRTGKHGVFVPAQTAPYVTPSLILAPLLAFDTEGYRLGWGGGYYDRTLETLRNSGNPILAVGVGFECQRVDRIPVSPFDQQLDWIITEQEIRKIDRTASSKVG